MSRLKSLPLFEGVPEQDLAKISPFVSEVSVSEGKQLVQEGDYAYEFMAIEEGSAEVTRGDERLAELGPGDFFGEMGLLGEDKRNATVVAKSPMRLVTLDRWDMRAWRRRFRARREDQTDRPAAQRLLTPRSSRPARSSARRGAPKGW